VECVELVTSVGATLRLFLSPPGCSAGVSGALVCPAASFESVLNDGFGAPSLLPRTLLLPFSPLRGVSGGVVNGTPDTVTPGSAPRVGVGLLTAVLEAIDEADEDLAGELGR